MNEKARVEVWAPVFISLCALGLSIWEAERTRLHDRLSVRPDCRLITTWSGTRLAISIVNSGLGPAKIDDFRAQLEDKPIRYWKELRDSLSVEGPFTRYERRPWGLSIPAGSEVLIFELKWKTPTDSTDDLKGDVSHLKYDICVSSMYEEQWTVTGRATRDYTITNGCDSFRIHDFPGV